MFSQFYMSLVEQFGLIHVLNQTVPAAGN